MFLEQNCDRGSVVDTVALLLWLGWLREIEESFCKTFKNSKGVKQGSYASG